MTQQISRAHIQRSTKRVVLPMLNAERVTFAVAGCWGLAEDGPDATTVEVRCLTRKAKRNGSYRLTHDTTFELPANTISVEIDVLQAVPSTRLEVSLRPYVAPPAPPPKSEASPLGPWAWDASYRDGSYGLQRRRQQRKA